MSIYVIIGLMAVVTMMPRILPVFLLNRLRLPEWIQKWLSNVPYAVLGALIFPGIMTVEPEQPWVGIFGGIIAIILSLRRVAIGYIIIGSIGAVLLLKQFI